MTGAQTTIDMAYKLSSLLKILSMAADGGKFDGKSFVHCGGGLILDMAADMAGEILEALEVAANNAPGVQ